MPPIGAVRYFCCWLSLHLDSSIKGSASSSKSQIIAMMDSCLSANSHDDSRCHTCRMRLAYWIIHLQTTILLEMQTMIWNEATHGLDRCKRCKVVEKISRPPAKNAHSAGKLKKRPTRDVGAGFSRPDAMGFEWRHADPPTLSLALAWDSQRQPMETTRKPAWESWYVMRISDHPFSSVMNIVLDPSLKQAHNGGKYREGTGFIFIYSPSTYLLSWLGSFIAQNRTKDQERTYTAT